MSSHQVSLIVCDPQFPHLQDVFDTWMKRQSDLVQATALAYAEREVLEASVRAMSEACPCPSYFFLFICLTFELCSVHRL